MKNRKELGEGLKALRQEKGLTQSDVSENTLYGEGHLSRIERHGDSLSLESLLNLVEFYGYELEFVKICDVSEVSEGKK